VSDFKRSPDPPLKNYHLIQK